MEDFFLHLPFNSPFFCSLPLPPYLCFGAIVASTLPAALFVLHAQWSNTQTLILICYNAPRTNDTIDRKGKSNIISMFHPKFSNLSSPNCWIGGNSSIPVQCLPRTLWNFYRRQGKPCWGQFPSPLAAWWLGNTQDSYLFLGWLVNRREHHNEFFDA